MHRVLQHRTSRMFLAKDGTLTPYIWTAAEFPNLKAAIRLCNRFALPPSDFSFRVFELESEATRQALSSM